jgi:hypothetical protein
VAIDEGSVRRSKVGNVSTTVADTDDRVIPTHLTVIKHDSGIDSTDDRILDQIESRTRAFAARDDQREPHGCPSYRVGGPGGQLASLPRIWNHLATSAGGKPVNRRVGVLVDALSTGASPSARGEDGLSGKKSVVGLVLVGTRRLTELVLDSIGFQPQVMPRARILRTPSGQPA